MALASEEKNPFFEFQSGVTRERSTFPGYLEENSDSRTSSEEPVSQGRLEVSWTSGRARTGNPLLEEEGRREGKERRAV